MFYISNYTICFMARMSILMYVHSNICRLIQQYVLALIFISLFILPIVMSFAFTRIDKKLMCIKTCIHAYECCVRLSILIPDNCV